MKKATSYEIAFAAVSASMSLFFVWLGSFVDFFSITMNCLAAVMLMLPLTIKSLRTSFLSYVAVAGLSFAVAPFPKQLPFVLFYGLYAFLGYLLNDKVKNVYIRYLIKLIYFNIVLYALFKLMGLTLSEILIFNMEMKYYILAICGSLLFLLYDYIYYLILKTITVLVNKRIKPKTPKKNYSGVNEKEAEKNKDEWDIFS